MSILEISTYLETDKNCIKINKNLLKVLESEEAFLYCYLVEKAKKDYKNEDYKIFDDKICFYFPIEEIYKILNLTPFKQRNLLAKLEKKKLLEVKFGQARARYISFNENLDFLKELMFGKKSIRKLEEELFMLVQYEILNNNKRDSKLLKYIKESNPALAQKISKLENPYILQNNS